MTILIGFHQSCYRNFKAYYQDKVQVQWQGYFPGLVSYHRFVEWMQAYPIASVCLSALLFWFVYRHQFFGFYQSQSLSQSADKSSSGVPKSGCSRQNFS
jgi:hypothetical protein